MRGVALFSVLAMALAQPSMAGPLEDYEALREEMWQAALDDSPLLATRVGDRRGDGKLGDLSVEGYEADIEQAREFLARFEAISPINLPVEEQVDYAVLKQGLEDRIAASDHDHTRYILFTTFSGWFQNFASLPYSSPFFTEDDYKSYNDRLAAYRDYNREGIRRSQEAIRRGLTQPCEPLQGFDRRIAIQIVEDPKASPFWKPYDRERPSTIPEDLWERHKKYAELMIKESVMAGYRDLLAFYVREYAPACRTGLPGISQTPGGAEYYADRVKSFTTTDMTPDEVHQLGLSEVARIRAEMEQVAASAGFETREAFIEHLRTDPQYYMTDVDEYVEHVAALAKKIDGYLPSLFGRLPRNPYTVLPIPAAQAPGNTTAYYERGSLEAGTAGIYRINTTELDQRPLWELPALGVHEAMPGHHLQIALQQELEMHPLRANSSYFTAFVEGWGLYSERLGIEMGLYDTPAKEMGRLSYEMWRATRLVVDTGIHSKGWSKQQAVDYMLDNTALSPANIDAEVNRYITWPGQALAYKVGELKIRELRRWAEDYMGAGFDLRQFHDIVLANGAVPLSVLDQYVRATYAGEKAKRAAEARGAR